jgi:HD-like signal output (HDOD) protein
MVKTWDFPAMFVAACKHHHDPIFADDSGLLQTIKLACRLADAIGSSAVNYAQPPGYEEVMRSLPPHLSRQRFPSAEELSARVEDRLKSFV